MEIKVLPPDHLTWNGRRVRCALGRSGILSDKQEGDGATPAGTSILTLDSILTDSAIAETRKVMTKMASTIEARLWPVNETPKTRP